MAEFIIVLDINLYAFDTRQEAIALFVRPGAIA